MRCRALFLTLILGAFTSVGVLAQDKTLMVRAIADAPSFAKRALVVGVGQYEHAGSLAPATINDARLFARLLQTKFKFPNEAVTLLTDAPGTLESQRPTYIHLRNAIKNLLAGINDKSEVIVYFSGHGIRAQDHDWLVPMDGLPADVEGTCINYDAFKSHLNTLLPARAMLIVDACRNLADGKDAGSSGFGASKGLAGPQFAEMLSCRPKEESKVGKPADFAESVFTHFLVQGLQGDAEAQDNGLITFDSLNAYVQGRVSQYVSRNYGESQNPDGRASSGKMVLVRAQNVSLPGLPGTTSIVPGKNPERPTLPIGARRFTDAVRPTQPQLGDIWINPKDGAELVYIPAGPFVMGDDDDEIRDFVVNSAILRNNPRHTVRLSGYWIYRNVVTVEEYQKFCQLTGRSMPATPRFNSDWRHVHNPIVNVTWDDAVAYATWAGMTLPTEAQWEKAARGGDDRPFAWGDEFDLKKVWGSTRRNEDAGSTIAVGKFGVSPYGCSDMGGNVAQWCLDWYTPWFWASDAAQRDDPANLVMGRKTDKVLRGCPWVTVPTRFFRTAFRLHQPSTRYSDRDGFRCARPLVP